MEVKELINLADDSKVLKQMTNEEWQNTLTSLRLHNRPSKEKTLKRRGTHVRVIGRTWSLSKGNGDGMQSLDSYYVNFIKDVLQVIRKGKCDYVYHIYHVAELLRFEPELLADLVMIDGKVYIKVWLSK